MVAWQTTWKGISASIASMLDVGELYLRGLSGPTGSDNHGVSGTLIANARETFNALREFEAARGAAIPPVAATALRAFLAARGPLFDSLRTGIGDAWTGVVLLASARTQIEYHLGDRDAVVVRIVERAFLHLQRSIIACPEMAVKWQRAFGQGETEGERLGSVHLLLHGIWAFKTSTTGERTDLVLGERLEITAEIERTADALVLTEWKRVSSPGQANQLAEMALRQAQLYGVGVLAGFELSAHRYIVLVSQLRLPWREPLQYGGVTYHFVNIAVTPDSPSRETRSVRGRGRVRE
jgi:hypothetical protein